MLIGVNYEKNTKKKDDGNKCEPRKKHKRGRQWQ
jgi:hypothetical protein